MAMNALYKGKLYYVGDTLQKCSLLDDSGEITTVDFGDPDLIIDPTDTQIKEQTNERD